MTLLQPLSNTSLLTPYKQYYVHSLHKEGKLISEQSPGNPNPLLLLAIDHFHEQPSQIETYAQCTGLHAGLSGLQPLHLGMYYLFSVNTCHAHSTTLKRPPPHHTLTLTLTHTHLTHHATQTMIN